MKAQLGSTTIPLELRVHDVATGAVTGLTVTAAIRRLSDGFYLDFDDGTFKAAAWTTRTVSLVEQGGQELDGVYTYTWDPSAIVTDQGDYAVDFAWQEGGVDQFASEPLEFVDSALAEKIIGNRLEIDEGTSKLKIYAKDGTTVVATWPLTDKDGSSVALEGTGPANRGVQD